MGSFFETEMNKNLSKLAADVIPSKEILKKANESVNNVSFYLSYYYVVHFDTYCMYAVAYGDFFCAVPFLLDEIIELLK